MPIKIDNLSFTYQPGTRYEHQALNSISLSVAEGQKIGIIGASGSGKSTLLQILNGLLTTASGRVVVDGLDLAGIKKGQLPEITRQVGLVFQHPEEQIFSDTVYDEVAFAPRNLGFYPPEVEKRVKEALLNLGLDEQMYSRKTNSLSSGEKRRVAIASVLALKPKYLLLDEPNAGLDYEGRKLLEDCLSDLNHKQGTTIIQVSHDLEQLVPFSDRIIVLEDGHLALDAAAANLGRHRQLLKELYINLPVFQETICQLNQRGWGLFPEAGTPSQAAGEIIACLRAVNQHQRLGE